MASILVRYERWVADSQVDIAGLPRHMVLRALVNGAEALVQARAKAAADANVPAARYYYWDYVWGRPIKTNLSSVLVDPGLYDRDQGRGAMQRVVDELRKEIA